MNTCYSPNDKLPEPDTIVIGEGYGLMYYRYVLTDRDGEPEGDWLYGRTQSDPHLEWADPPRWWMTMPEQSMKASTQ